MARVIRITFAQMEPPFRKDWRVHWTAAEARGSRKVISLEWHDGRPLLTFTQRGLASEDEYDRHSGSDPLSIRSDEMTRDPLLVDV